MTTADTGKSKLVIDRPKLDSQFRIAGFAAAASFLKQFETVGAAFGMKPNKMLVYLVIIIATVQKAMRAPDTISNYHGKQRLPRDVIGYISRRAIAEATGLPRENVRRITQELIDDGLLIVGPGNRLANKGQILDRPEVAAGIEALLTELLGLSQRMVDLGVITVADREGAD